MHDVSTQDAITRSHLRTNIIQTKLPLASNVTELYRLHLPSFFRFDIIRILCYQWHFNNHIGAKCISFTLPGSTLLRIILRRLSGSWTSLSGVSHGNWNWYYICKWHLKYIMVILIQQHRIYCQSKNSKLCFAATSHCSRRPTENT